MSTRFVGEIRLFGFNFAPVGWAFCNGALVQISQFDTLFSLIGTTYGGDGVSTFAFPDLRARMPIHQGQGPGLSNYIIGQASGVQTVTLTAGQMPAHVHPVRASSSSGTAVPSPAGNVWSANPNTAAPQFATSGTATPMAPTMIGPAGGNQPHDNLAPYLGINFCISLEGLYPS